MKRREWVVIEVYMLNECVVLVEGNRRVVKVFVFINVNKYDERVITIYVYS